MKDDPFTKTKFDKIKEHFAYHKNTYIACAVTAVVTAGVTVLIVSRTKIAPELSQKAIALWHSTVNQTAVQIVIDAPGNAGNVVKDLTTGAIYPSQNAAAKALGVDQGNLSKHLAGKLPNVSGHTFEKLIDGSAPHALLKV